MQHLVRRPLARLLVPALLVVGASSTAPSVAAQDSTAEFGSVFDEHWERLRDDYPYFELYGVNWEAERADHRPRAVAAESAGEFAWEMARLLSVLKDPHVEYRPPIDVMTGWAIPDLRTGMIEHKPHEADRPETWNEDPRRARGRQPGVHLVDDSP